MRVEAHLTQHKLLFLSTFQVYKPEEAAYYR